MNPIEFAEKATRRMRQGADAQSSSLRGFLVEQGIDPRNVAIATQFPEDVGQFTLLVDRDGNGYTCILMASRDAIVVADWMQLDQDELAGYADELSVGASVLNADPNPY